MNIIYITNHLNIGGITSYVLTLTKSLKVKGHEVYLASSGGEALPRFIGAGANFIAIPIKTKSEISPKILLSFFSLKKLVKDKHIDIIHSHSRTTQVLGHLLSKKTGVPHITTCHGFFKPRWSRKKFPCWGKQVIAISESVKEHLIRDFGVKEQNIRVIHNGIDIERFKIQGSKFKAEIKNNLGLGDGPVVGIVARLSDVKGHTFLIQAMRIVLEKIPQAQLLIFGEGREEKALVNLCRSLKIEKNVIFLPKLVDTADVLSAMDLFVLPSLKEGLGLALMEAMASGLAVIGSDVGGIKTLIQNGENGILVKPKDIAGLSSAIVELLQNSAQREFLGSRARTFISDNFNQEKMVAQTEGVYRECINEKD